MKSREPLTPRSMTTRKQMTGLRFGRLIVLSEAGITSNRIIRYLCRCDCGTIKVISGDSLRRQLTVSCGCFCREKRSLLSKLQGTHYLTGTPTYASWAQMIQRCYNQNNPKYPHYGGRGISVCDRWVKFENFVADMGIRPIGKTIHRINNDGNYCPDNCKWAGNIEQARNRTNNRLLTFQGETFTAVEWAERIGLSYVALRMRLHRGWSTERALSCK